MSDDRVVLLEREGPVPSRYPDPPRGFIRWTEGLPTLRWWQPRFRVYRHDTRTAEFIGTTDFWLLPVAKLWAVDSGDWWEIWDMGTNSWFRPPQMGHENQIARAEMVRRKNALLEKFNRPSGV